MKFKRPVAIVVAIFSLAFFLVPQKALAGSTVRVSGFTSPRSRAPLIDPSGNPTTDSFEGSSSLVNAFLDSNNFGPGGTVSCPVDIKPFVTSISSGSLVSAGSRKMDVFFAGVTNDPLSLVEANELVDFINAGGIVYVSGSPMDSEGPGFNQLFSSLGIADNFDIEIDYSSFEGESSNPLDSPITTGPFGNISGMFHSPFRIINTSSLAPLADGFETGGMVVLSVTPGSGLSDEIILAEGAFGSGYLSVTGDLMSTNYLIGMDPDNLNYFLNLFALGCSEDLSSTPIPFLDLPWDYKGKDLSFSDAALVINSFFDHEYPLLSSGLNEPSGILTFDGQKSPERFYSSHDGYDWGRNAKATKGESVLAAASGTATYWGGCSACGNAILIDHGNGYQTRYYHLSDEDLVVNQEGSSMQVNKGQKIGLVGYTGKVIPSGERGAHIHFMVVQDKNNDGNFSDNIPDGLVDPFGWQSTQQDPWPNYNFYYNGQDRTGSASYYLWTKAIANLSKELTSNGGFFKLERYGVSFPQGTTSDPLTVEMRSSPTTTAPNLFGSIGFSLMLNVIDATGNPITTFPNPFTLTIDFNSFDLGRYDTNTISIYSSEDGVDWTKEETDIDLNAMNASAQLSHSSYFALMAERLDTTPPTTNAVFSGEEGEDGWFRSDVQVTLDAQDNEGGLGVDYTLYRIGDGDWQEYASFLDFTDEGDYSIEFYSIDNDENIEETKLVEFSIDKTPPEAMIQFNLDTHKAEVVGLDESGETQIVKKKFHKHSQRIVIADKAGNTLTLTGKYIKKRKSIFWTIKSISYNENTPVNLKKNLFYTRFGLRRNGVLRILTQNWLNKDDILIKIIYRAKSDRSIILTRKPGQKAQKETRSGLVLLSVQTDNGNLVYKYK